MAHSDSDRNFWVRTVVGVMAMAMIGACVLKYGDKMETIGWIVLAVVFVLIVLAIILPPKTYIESVKSINLAGIASAWKFGRRKDDDPPPPAGDPPPPATP